MSEPQTQPNSHQAITVFAQTTFRGSLQRFGIRQADRRAHMLC